VTTASIAQIRIIDLRWRCCADTVMEAVRAIPGVREAELDYPSGVLALELDGLSASEQSVRAAIRAGGYQTADDDLTPSARQLAHTTNMTPVTCCTGADRMQYELPHSTARHAHKDPAQYPHGGHGGMDHDMSDPTMAAAMEHDMRNRFVVALVLTIPVIIFSPLGYDTLGIRPVHSLTARNLIALVPATPVVFYAGWVFIAGAYTSLRNRALNMSVLVATGVLSAWGGVRRCCSPARTRSSTAAAMLVTFVLFGRWMEMKSRRGTSDSLRALFDIVPPTATVIRAGRDVEVSTADIVVDDLVRLRQATRFPSTGSSPRGRARWTKA
jgi:Cu2+-exporting ATPase